MLQIGRTIGNYGVIRTAAARLLRKPHCLPFPNQFIVRPAAVTIQARYFSNEDFKKTLNDIKSKQDEKVNQDTDPSAEKKESPSSSAEAPRASFDASGMFGSVGSLYHSFVDNVKLAYAEMMGTDKESALTRRVDQAESYRPAKKDDDDDDDDEDGNPKKKKEEVPAGPSALVVVKEAKSPWEQMKDRLQDSPLIKELLKNSRHYRKAASETDLGKKAEYLGKSVQDKMHDAREFWETSQNPLVYTLSGAWDNLTGETEEGIAISEIRKLDPNFNKEEWTEEVKGNLAPLIIKAHLQGDTTTLKPWCGEAVYNKLAADIRTRKHDGIVFDSNILEVEENQTILKVVESGRPVIVIVFMVQQINCIRNREGEIIEGSESDVRAKFYSIAFQQDYSEDDVSVRWKVVDYEFAGDIPYY